ncbi:hypothetical protein E2542_SST04567 [Spatholobus suberectus]|nr:hypothetical protein E2542_SST04567 [Spatholobus suberectus]
MKNQTEKKERWIFELVEDWPENSPETDGSVLENEEPTSGCHKACWKVGSEQLEQGRSRIELNRGEVWSSSCTTEEEEIAKHRKKLQHPLFAAILAMKHAAPATMTMRDATALGGAASKSKIGMEFLYLVELFGDPRCMVWNQLKVQSWMEGSQVFLISFCKLVLKLLILGFLLPCSNPSLLHCSCLYHFHSVYSAFIALRTQFQHLHCASEPHCCHCLLLLLTTSFHPEILLGGVPAPTRPDPQSLPPETASHTHVVSLRGKLLHCVRVKEELAAGCNLDTTLDRSVNLSLFLLLLLLFHSYHILTNQTTFRFHFLFNLASHSPSQSKTKIHTVLVCKHSL